MFLCGIKHLFVCGVSLLTKAQFLLAEGSEDADGITSRGQTHEVPRRLSGCGTQSRRKHVQVLLSSSLTGSSLGRKGVPEIIFA